MQRRYILVNFKEINVTHHIGSLNISVTLNFEVNCSNFTYYTKLQSNIYRDTTVLSAANDLYRLHGLKGAL